jgi:hypothetical protein
MDDALGVKAVGAASLLHEADETALKNTGAYAAEHILLCLALEHHTLDPAPVQQL